MSEKNASLASLDKNMQIASTIDRPGLKYYDAESEPFRIYGVWRQNNSFARLPSIVCAVFNKSLAPEDRDKAEHRSQTAGGRIRFITDSPYVSVNVKLQDTYQYMVMSVTGTCGLDLYADNKFVGAYRPSIHQEDGWFESLIEVGGRKKRVITINLPLYCNVEKIYIGRDENSVIERSPDYTYEKPIVFYGSSITHGACASRPGMNYPSQVCRLIDANHHNLGFGGCAKGEPEIAEYIAGLDMCMFVYDYDYNAPDAKYLAETHEPMFKKIREKHPDLPIVMMTAPKPNLTSAWAERRAVIQRTYDNAVASGDKNVYILYGSDLISGLGEDFSPDACHPSDLVYYYIAHRVAPVLQRILSGEDYPDWEAPKFEI